MRTSQIVRFSTIMIIVALFSLNLFSVVIAHRQHVDGTSHTIEIEAYYGECKPVKNGDVSVYNPDGEIILNRTTDENGKFSLELTDPEQKSVTVEIEQLGHRTEITIGTGGSSTETSELPLYQLAIAGLGYLLGLAGLTVFYLTWRKKRSINSPELEANPQNNKNEKH